MSVVTLMPPAVDVLPPPTSINIIVISVVLSCIAPVSMVLKPAVRGVTAWNQLAHSFAPGPFNPPRVPGFDHSKKANITKANAIRLPVPTSISLEWSVNAPQRRF